MRSAIGGGVRLNGCLGCAWCSTVIRGSIAAVDISFLAMIPRAVTTFLLIGVLVVGGVVVAVSIIAVATVIVVLVVVVVVVVFVVRVVVVFLFVVGGRACDFVCRCCCFRALIAAVVLAVLVAVVVAGAIAVAALPSRGRALMRILSSPL